MSAREFHDKCNNIVIVNKFFIYNNNRTIRTGAIDEIRVKGARLIFYSHVKGKEPIYWIRFKTKEDAENVNDYILSVLSGVVTNNSVVPSRNFYTTENYAREQSHYFPRTLGRE